MTYEEGSNARMVLEYLAPSGALVDLLATAFSQGRAFTVDLRVAILQGRGATRVVSGGAIVDVRSELGQVA